MRVSVSPSNNLPQKPPDEEEPVPAFFYGKVINGFPAININRGGGCSLWEGAAGKEHSCIYCKWCASFYDPPLVPIRTEVCTNPVHATEKPKGEVR